MIVLPDVVDDPLGNGISLVSCLLVELSRNCVVNPPVSMMKLGQRIWYKLPGRPPDAA